MDVVGVKVKTFQVGQTWRVAKDSERKITRKLREPIEVVAKRDITLGNCMDVNCSKQENFTRRVGRHGFGNRLPGLEISNLLLAELYVLAEKALQITSLTEAAIG